MDQNRANGGDGLDEAPGLVQPAVRRIYLVRHGVTEWNKQFRYQGSADIPLSAEGEEQADRVGLRLSQLRVERIISSPLRRAMGTALRIAERVDVDNVEQWEDLREVDFGDWEGLTVREIVAKFGEDNFDAWRRAQIDVTAANGEDARSVYDRAGRAVQRLSGMQDEVTVVVSHGAIFRALMLHFIDVPKSSVFWKMRMDNCSVSAVEFDRKGRRSVRFFNDTVHLRAERGIIHSIPLQ